MSGTQISQRHFAAKVAADRNRDTESFDYLPPSRLLLQQLGISARDLENPGTVPVPRKVVRALLNELARRQRMDEAWYAKIYPDVEGARLAGDVTSLREHFATSGYIEGRLPAEMPFDPEWYRAHYPDIADAFQSADRAALLAHFLNTGYHEGRAGTVEMLKEAERWRALIAA